MNSVILLSIIK